MKKIPMSQCSEYKRNTKLEPFYPTKKLLCDHSDEEFFKYFLLIKISQGLEVTKVPRIVSSEQKPSPKQILSKIAKKENSN